MNDYISKEAVIKEQQRFCGYLDNDMLNRLEIAIKRIPSANVKERKTGKWVLKTFDDGYGEYQLYECDKCGSVSAHRTNYCHNCGAKMESEE